MHTPQELFNLEGKVAIVTGGSRGIGAAISKGLKAAGKPYNMTSTEAVGKRLKAERELAEKKGKDGRATA